MIFQTLNRYGNKRFYPIDKEASVFLKAFPNSRGERKCLSKTQLKLLKKMGMNVKVQMSCQP